MVARMSVDDDPFRSRPGRSIPTRRRVQVRGLSADEAREALAWADAHRGRAPRGAGRQVGEAVAKVVRPLARRFGPGVSELVERWEEIVGAPLAAWSYPERYQSGAGGVALVVRAKGPAAALIEAQSAQILDRVATYSGKPVRRLKLVQGALNTQTPVRARRAQRIVKTGEKAPQALAESPEARLEQTLNAWRRDFGLTPAPPLGPKPGPDD